MKKILTLVTFFVFIIACSDDDSTNQQETVEFPSNISITTQPVSIGDVLTISGSGFSTTENYIVTFTDNVIGTINGVTTNSLEVEVPQNATSGNITLTLNTITEVIGNITIENNDVSESVYIYHESENKLANLNIENGMLTYIADFTSSGTTAGAVYHPQNNEYILFSNNTDPNYVRVNLTTGNIIYQVIDPSVIAGDGTDMFSAPIVDSIGNVYIYHESASLLAKLDVETGEITYVTDGVSGGTTVGAVYHPQNNEYVFFSNNTDPNYTRINLTTGNIIYQVIDPSVIAGDGTDVFSAPVIDNNGDIYIYHKSANLLAKLDVETGGITYITDGIPSGTTAGAVYQNNEYVFFSNNTDPNFARVNLTTAGIIYEVVSSPLLNNDGSDIFSGLVNTL